MRGLGLSTMVLISIQHIFCVFLSHRLHASRTSRSHVQESSSRSYQCSASSWLSPTWPSSSQSKGFSFCCPTRSSPPYRYARWVSTLPSLTVKTSGLQTALSQSTVLNVFVVADGMYRENLRPAEVEHREVRDDCVCLRFCLWVLYMILGLSFHNFIE